MMVRLGARWAARRLLTAPSILTWGFTLLVIAVTGLMERRSGSPLGTDRMLLGPVAGLAIPLLAYAAIARLTHRGAWTESCEALARFGGNRRLWMLGVSMTGGTLLAIASASCAVVGLLVVGGTGVLPLGTDLVRTSVITGLAGIAYTAFFGLAALLRSRELLGPAFLLLDWLLGDLRSAISLPFPRGHVGTLLGSAGVMGMTQAEVWSVLWGLVLAYIVLGLLRLPS